MCTQTLQMLNMASTPTPIPSSISHLAPIYLCGCVPGPNKSFTCYSIGRNSSIRFHVRGAVPLYKMHVHCSTWYQLSLVHITVSYSSYQLWSKCKTPHCYWK
ncbi:hypothetical protein XENTR_v10020833 [Xenopus tropicalis]|nr:hypothetical protein XENTR_v10020833 [Xenopus tropicalis]